MVNNLGSVTGLEMTLIVKDVMEQIKQFEGVKVLRVVSGTLMSSLDMNGMSLTVLKLNEANKAEVLSYLDMPVDSPFWPGITNTENASQNIIELGIEQSKVDKKDFSGTESKFRDGAKTIFNKIIEQADELTKQDSDVGDGDLGIGASRASKNSMEILNYQDFENDLVNALISIGDIFSDGFGGSSGPLWGVFISQGATMLKPKLSDNTNEDWIKAYNEGLKAMMKVGGAEKGDRTMVDALIYG